MRAFKNLEEILKNLEKTLKLVAILEFNVLKSYFLLHYLV